MRTRISGLQRVPYDEGPSPDALCAAAEQLLAAAYLLLDPSQDPASVLWALETSAYVYREAVLATRRAQLQIGTRWCRTEPPGTIARITKIEDNVVQGEYLDKTVFGFTFPTSVFLRRFEPEAP